jgi:uncharacterized protein
MTSKYNFKWEMLGDLAVGRPNLGNRTYVEVYRLMQFCMRDVIERNFGTDEADRIFYDAGWLAGSHFYDHKLTGTANLNEFIKMVQSSLKELEIGILRIEEISPNMDRIILTVAEDLDCSGLPNLTYEVCRYDEGFIAALLERFTGKVFRVKEIDCWCTGDRTCRFQAELVRSSDNDSTGKS